MAVLAEVEDMLSLVWYVRQPCPCVSTFNEFKL